VISRSAPEREELLPGAKPKAQFFLHKVQYRKGDELQRSFQTMSDSLRETENIDVDLVNTLGSAQWLESSNSLIFSGTTESLKKISSLVDQIDTPLRQVFIEMLVLEATLVDALNYSVKWGNNLAAATGPAPMPSQPPPIPITSALTQSGITNLGSPVTLNPQQDCPYWRK